MAQGSASVDHHGGSRRQLAEARPDAFLPGLATSLHTFSVRLADLGLDEDALHAIEQANDIWQQLAGRHPGAFTKELNREREFRNWLIDWSVVSLPDNPSRASREARRPLPHH
jgi:hypothetical protein